MANTDHIAWIREGVAAWNARREQSEFWPDFEGANLPAIFQGPSYSPASIHLGTSLEGINLRNASLRNANLSGLNLAKADLTEAQLQGASLASADLRGATLSMANFSATILLAAKLNSASAVGTNFARANLSGACLDDANLRQASFAGANLVSASIKKADLRDSVLAGADLSSTEPWEAILYEHSEPKTAGPSLLADQVGSVGELIEIANCLTQHYNPPPEQTDIEASLLYFRGEVLATWELRPSSARTPSPQQPDIRGREGEMLLDLMSRRPGKFNQITSALSQWVLAQHHGLKT